MPHRCQSLQGVLPRSASSPGLARAEGCPPHPAAESRFWRTATRLAVIGLVPLFSAACGDEEAPPQQAAVWLTLGTPLGGNCPALDNFEFPDDARTIITTDGKAPPGEPARVVDGADLVSCRVAGVAGMPDVFDVEFEFSAGAIGNMIAEGQVSEAAGGTLDVNLQANSGGLELAQDGCAVTVKEALAGAVWITSLSCSNMLQARSPGQACTGTGGLILENCAR